MFDKEVDLMKKRIGFLYLIIFLLPFIQLFKPTMAQAYSVPDRTSVYEHAPKGMKLNDFVTAPEYYTNTKTNDTTAFKSSSKIIRAGDSNNDSTDIIQLLDGSSTQKKQIGSFWGTVKDSNGNKTYNYFDLSKPQEISVWFYGGSKVDGYDGFAFVLQNDDLGDQAISRSNGVPTAGETLGVWGGGTPDNKTTTTKLSGASDGIQKSVAIEFDHYVNKTAGSFSNSVNDYLDYDKFSMSNPGNIVMNQLKTGHIAWNYPGDTATYMENSYSLILNNYFYNITHRGPVQNNSYFTGYDGLEVANSETQDPRNGWRHLKITYTPPTTGTTARLSYLINDKFPDGTDKMQTAQDSKTFSIDISKLIGTSDDKKVRWGFTASTGSPESSIDDLDMVIEKMPSIVDMKGTSQITDVTKNSSKTLGSTKELSTSDGDEIKLEQKLAYSGGISESGEIKATVGLPENVEYNGDANGVIGKMTYQDEDGTTKTQEINKSDLKDVTITIPGKYETDPPSYKTVKGFDVTIPSMNAIGDNSNIEVYGTVKGPESSTPITTSVSGVNTSYQADNYTGDTMSPDFVIDNEVLHIENTNSLSQELNLGDEAHFQGNISYLKGSTFDGEELLSNLEVYDQDGNKLSGVQKGDIQVDKGVKTGTYDIPYTLNGLEADKTYTFKLKLSDSKDRISNTLEYKVKIKPKKNLQLEVDNYRFQTINAGSKIGEYVKRSGNWDIDVNSTGTKWKLSAQSTGLFNKEDSSYSEPLYFIDKDLNAKSLNDDTLIAQQDTVNSGESQNTDVTDAWSEEDGILLKNEFPNLAGDYTGKIEWTLSETI